MAAKKQSFKKKYFTLTVVTLVVEEQLPHLCSAPGIQICGDFLKE